MATITAVGTYLDNGTARTAGEAMTIDSGGQLIVRTDTRVHANAPASMTGYLGAITVNEGECFIDAQNVRWLAYNTGTGNVPAIGTTISQGGVSGYLLGVWVNYTSAPTAAAAAMPATGFIKFREVSGGEFAAGALTGIGASATSADVAGWIEVVLGSAVDIGVARLGKLKTRGQWFYLDNTTGTRGQVLQVPTNGGGANTFVPGAWIETSPGSNVYDQYPALNGAANGWSVIHMGSAEGFSDRRQKFVKMLSNGQMQVGETVTFASTYGSVAAQASTYADWNVSATYTLTSNVCECFVSAGHGMYGGETVGLDFTTGSATDQNGTITVLDAYRFTVPITNADTSGNVTVRMGATVTFTNHTLAEGNQVYLSVSTGTLTTNTYTVHSTASTSTYNITFPHTTVLTSGNCSALHTLTITRASHGMAVGNEVYLNFTSGGAASGNFVMRSVVAGSFNVNYPHSAAITAGATVTERYHIGFVPDSGCKVRIPNILMRAATTATNLIPHATIDSRPEITSFTLGDIDLEYFYGENFYLRLSRAYSLKLRHSALMDSFELFVLATAMDIDNVQLGHYSGAATYGFVAVGNLAGGTINNCKFHRQGTPGATAYPMRLQSCAGLSLTNVETGVLQFVRSTATFYIHLCADITLNNCRAISTQTHISYSSNVTVTNHDYIDRFSGKTNATTAIFAVGFTGGSDNTLDGITFGGGTLASVQPANGAVTLDFTANVKVRNCGSLSSPLVLNPWEPNLYAMAYLLRTVGYSNGIKIQRCVVSGLRGSFLLFGTADINGTIENVISKKFVLNLQNAVSTRLISLSNSISNCEVRSVTSDQFTSNPSGIYGTHFHSLFLGTTYGRLVLLMNEPSAETESYFTMVSGTRKFNAAGGILMGVVGNQATWEMPYFVLGHTGFVNEDPVVSGTSITLTNYTLEYQIDTGSGFSAWKTLNGANLSGETISPSTGFKMKYRITTLNTNTGVIRQLLVKTTTTESAQTTNLYPLDSNTITFTGLPTGCDAVVLTAGTSTIRDQRDSISGTTYAYTYSGAQNVDVGFIKPGYIPYYFRNLALATANSSIPVALTPDRNYE